MKNTCTPTACASRFFYDGSDRWSIEPVLVDDAQGRKAPRDAQGELNNDARRYAHASPTARGTLMTRLIALLLIAGTAALAGCNTMSGAGQDISKGGQAITNSAEEHK
jgi:predicted small secreted protein